MPEPFTGNPGAEASAPQLAAQAADPVFPVWVLTARQDGQVAGCTSLYPQSPPWFWTEAEQAEPALFMATTVTSPAFAGQRLGALIAWAALDLAARAGRTRVRRSTTEAGLVRYYRDVQGWQVVRQMERQGFLVTGMEREAEPQPGLPLRIADAGVPAELTDIRVRPVFQKHRPHHLERTVVSAFTDHARCCPPTL